MAGHWQLFFVCVCAYGPRHGQDGTILHAQVANHSVGFGSSCLLMELAINNDYVPQEIIGKNCQH